MALQVYPSDSKTFQVENGPKYAYIYYAAKEGKPTFLLLHGFPSSSYDWRYQIKDLSKAGYGVVAPDLLGYGDTDKPEAMEEYSFGPQSAHLAAILDYEGLKQVIAVGHDWYLSLYSLVILRLRGLQGCWSSWPLCELSTTTCRRSHFHVCQLHSASRLQSWCASPNNLN
jgi:pimeloyl-ACP methyl ester carboxylesterase